jgi:hypothetical protein
VGDPVGKHMECADGVHESLDHYSHERIFPYSPALYKDFYSQSIVLNLVISNSPFPLVESGPGFYAYFVLLSLKAYLGRASCYFAELNLVVI